MRGAWTAARKGPASWCIRKRSGTPTSTAPISTRSSRSTSRQAAWSNACSYERGGRAPLHRRRGGQDRDSRRSSRSYAQRGGARRPSAPALRRDARQQGGPDSRENFRRIGLRVAAAQFPRRRQIRRRARRRQRRDRRLAPRRRVCEENLRPAAARPGGILFRRGGSDAGRSAHEPLARGVGGRRGRPLSFGDRTRRLDRHPRRARRDRDTRESARLGAATGTAGRGHPRCGPFLPPAPEPHQEHRQRFMAVLAARNLRKSYGGAEVVAGVSFAIAPGECFGLLGPNGAGKTTTLRLCLGLTDPDHGSIELMQRPVPGEARPARARVGVVPQMDNLDPEFTVGENLLVYGRYFGLSEGPIRARIPQLLDFAGLSARAASQIQTLSGGMKRRLTLARALINDPDLIFMDEPTTGLDPQARHLIWERLKQLLAGGKTIVLTTHFMEEAERLCARLAIMDRGRFITEGSPRELILRHIEPHVVEAHGDGVMDWSDREAGKLASRLEKSGETVFCYAADPAPLLSSLANQGELRYLHRPANLEDVFLKLTGRELRD